MSAPCLLFRFRYSHNLQSYPILQQTWFDLQMCLLPSPAVFFTSLASTRSRCVVIPESLGRANLTLSHLSSHETMPQHSTITLLLECCCYSACSNDATHALAMFHVATPLRVRVRSQFIKKVSTITKFPCLLSIKYRRGRDLTVSLSWCLHVSSQHANHETRICSVTACNSAIQQLICTIELTQHAHPLY